jgi:hypothetical protein
MQLNARMAKRAEALLDTATVGARAPWTDKRRALLQAWNALDEQDRYLLCQHLDVADGAQFVLATIERLGAEDAARRTHAFALERLRS